MSRRAAFILIIVALISMLLACTQPTGVEDGVVEIGARPVESMTPIVIFVTPTSAPTQIPTYEIITPSVTPVPPTVTAPPTLTPDTARIEAECAATLTAIYENAGKLCLGKPRGFFCNGGLPPKAEPAGPVESALAVPGALVETGVVQMVETAPIMSNNSAGLLWMRLDSIQIDVFLAGHVQLRDATPQGSNLPAWQAMEVETYSTTNACPQLPRNSLIIQSEYGSPSRFALNGVSVDLDGTLAIQTENASTTLIVLEGRSVITVFGTLYSLFAGQQLTLQHPEGSYNAVSEQPAGVESLDTTRIEHLPVTLLDLPLELPQPGYARTQGNINLRTEPALNGRLIYQVPDDSVLSLLGANPEGDWLHVRLINGDTGWMSREFLQLNGENISAVYESTPVPPQRPGDLGDSAFVIAEQGGNLRTGPDVKFGIITTLPAGSLVRLQARSPYSSWVKVTDETGRTGWMALLTLDTQAAISFLAIDYDAPRPPQPVQPIPTATPELIRGGGHAYPDPLSGQ